METPLTPLEFARRARKLYPERVAVIDGDSRWTYAQFLDRCDRWSAVLQKLGIRPSDRVAYLSPNTHTQLESFYAVPQIGAVLVPLNYRLTAEGLGNRGAEGCPARMGERRNVQRHPGFWKLLARLDSLRDIPTGAAHLVFILLAP